VGGALNALPLYASYARWPPVRALLFPQVVMNDYLFLFVSITCISEGVSADISEGVSAWEIMQ
jgi:hypothetical protein